MTPTKPQRPSDAAITVPILWDREDPPPPSPANLYLIQTRPGEVVLTFGFVAPIIAGTPEEQQQQARQLSSDGAKPAYVTRLVLNAHVAQELHQSLGEQLASLGLNR